MRDLREARADLDDQAAGYSKPLKFVYNAVAWLWPSRQARQIQVVTPNQLEQDLSREDSKEKNLERFLTQWLPYEEHVRELAVVGLIGQAYTAHRYAEVLQTFLGIHIKIRKVPVIVRNPAKSYTAEKRGAALASLEFDEATHTATLWVLDDLDWWLEQYVVFHELAHLAAGHPFAERSADNGEIRSFMAVKKKQLARKSPLAVKNGAEELPEELRSIRPEKVREAEAELRAQYNMITGLLGVRSLEFDRLAQLR